MHHTHPDRLWTSCVTMMMTMNTMMTIVIGVLFVSSFSLVGCSTPITGALSGNVQWNIGDSPYLVSASVTIPNGAILNIDPGVQVLFNPDAYMIVLGTLIAQGSSSSRILFSNGTTSLWGGVIFGSSSSAATLTISNDGNAYTVQSTASSILAYCDFFMAGVMVGSSPLYTRGMVTLQGTASPYIDNCLFSSPPSILSQFISLYASSGLDPSTEVYSNGKYTSNIGLSVDTGQPIVTNCVFTNLVSGVVSRFGMARGGWINSNTFESIAYRAILLGESACSSYPFIFSNNIIRGSGWANAVRTVTSSSQLGTVCTISSSACQSIIIENHFYNITGTATILYVAGSSTTISYNQFYSNQISRISFLDNEAHPLRFGAIIAISASGNSPGLYFSNNYIFNNKLVGPYSAAIMSTYSASGVVVIRNNTYTNNTLTSPPSFSYRPSILFVDGYNPTIQNNTFDNPSFGYEVWNKNDYVYDKVMDVSLNYYGTNSNSNATYVRSKIYYHANDNLVGLAVWSPFYDTPSLSTTFTDPLIGITGVLKSSMNWTDESSPYYITNLFTIPLGITLFIAPGVSVLFQPGATMLVRGYVVAVGNVSSPILFSSGSISGGSPLPGSWNGVLIFTERPSSGTLCSLSSGPSIVNNASLSYTISRVGLCNYFEYVYFQYGGRSGSMLIVSALSQNAPIAILRSRFTYSAGPGINIASSCFECMVILADNVIANNTGRGLTVKYATAISGNEISRNFGGGMSVLVGSSMYIVNNSISFNGNRNSDCVANPAGLQIDTGPAFIVNNVIRNNTCQRSGALSGALYLPNMQSGLVANNQISGNDMNYPVYIVHISNSLLSIIGNSIISNYGWAAFCFVGAPLNFNNDWETSMTQQYYDVIEGNLIEGNAFRGISQTPQFPPAAFIVNAFYVRINNNTIYNPSMTYEMYNSRLYPTYSNAFKLTPSVNALYNFWGPLASAPGSLANESLLLIKARLLQGPPNAFIDFDPWLKQRITPDDYFSNINMAVSGTASTGWAGSLTQDAVWNGTVLVTANVYIPPGIRVTITPGTIVYLHNATSIIVGGTLIADAAGESAGTMPIIFTSVLEQSGGTVPPAVAGSWGQIRFLKGSSVTPIANYTVDTASHSQTWHLGNVGNGTTSICNYCIFRYGGAYGVPMVHFGSSSGMVILRSTFSNARSSCLYSSGLIQVFESNFSMCNMINNEHHHIAV
eukprot:TRINITY_DN6033_c0_g1_i7.p1 TRINITY_DN6033_c0_g1~~TRINITY_DN6033_c0_g1_i7.p1  ORF type:complete len:1239 (+),score=157.91 TRINITY_DN6033_c0_g1_i7:89-3718(+)